VADTHLDPDVLSALREVMENEFSTLIDTFLADSEVRLLRLKAGDTAQIFEAAHSFKGSSSNMGAIVLASLCHELEQLAKGKDLQGAGELVDKIEQEFALVRPLYEAERQRSLATVRRF
jgi:HPt (histidine-containing phosphotransfer) domain-containing protein